MPPRCDCQAQPSVPPPFSPPSTPQTGLPAGPSDRRVEPSGPSWCQWVPGPIGRRPPSSHDRGVAPLGAAPLSNGATLVSLLFCLKCGFMPDFLLLQHRRTSGTAPPPAPPGADRAANMLITRGFLRRHYRRWQTEPSDPNPQK